MMVNIKRLARHLAMTHWQVKRIFPPKTMQVIERAIKASEATHMGEIRFVVEGALDGASLWRGQSARARAIDVFSQLRVWDTEHNNGLLIYVLLADREVEIVADRGIHVKVGAAAWETICRGMESAFREGRYTEGVESGIAAISDLLVVHAPGVRGSNELSDRPVIL